MSLSNGTRSFATLLRNSKFISIGDLRNAIVIGKVFHVTNEDLYVDVGMKFHAVIKRPQTDSRLYVRGSQVKLKLLDYELTDKFIGDDHFVTINEADAILLNLESSPVGTKQKKPTQLE